MTNQSYFHGFFPSLSRISVCRETTLPRRSRQHLGAFLLRLGIRLAALLDKSHPLMKIFQTTRPEPMSDGQIAD
jgi:hypothetical protein